MPNPRSFPRFTPKGDNRVDIILSTGEVVDVDISELQSPLDIVSSVEHPDFEDAYAALKWFRIRGISAEEAFQDLNTVNQYLSATYIPMDVT